VIIEVKFIEKRQTDRGENGGHNWTIKVTFIEIRRTDWGQNGGHNVTIEVKFEKKGRQIGVKVGDIM